MEKMNRYVNIFLLSIICCAILSLSISDSSVEQLIKKINQYYTLFPEELVYLHTDKEFYKSKEKIWFKAYIVDPSDKHSSMLSNTLYIHLINSNGVESIQNKYKIENGFAKGTIDLIDKTAVGDYKLVAYTSWMKNMNVRNTFTKNIYIRNVYPSNYFIQVSPTDSIYCAGQNVTVKVLIASTFGNPISGQKFLYKLHYPNKIIEDGISRTNDDGKSLVKIRIPNSTEFQPLLITVESNLNGSLEKSTSIIPLIINKLRISFFPEGGDLIHGVESRLAFMAIDNNGSPIYIEGEVQDKYGITKSKFKTNSNGMGSVIIKPLKSDSLNIVVKNIPGINKRYYLPEPLSEGFTMTVTNNKDFIDVKTNASKNLRDEELYLIGTIGNKVYWATEEPFKPGKTIHMSSLKYPQGIARLTLFDKNLKPHAERLVYVNKQRKIYVSLSTDKNKYQTREKVNVTIQSYDEYKFPVSAVFSMAVVENTKIDAFPEHMNIQNYLNSSYELGGNILHNNLLFENKSADQALDHILLTYGWRRISWEKILNQPIQTSIQYMSHDYLDGRVINDRGKYISGASVLLLNINDDWEFYHTVCDSSGYFVFPNDIYVRVMDGEFIIKAESPKKYENVTVKLNRNFLDRVINYHVLNGNRQFESEDLPIEESISDFVSSDWISRSDSLKQANYLSSILKGTILIEEVEVKGKTHIDVEIPEEEYTRSYIEYSRKGEEIKDLGMDLVQLLQTIKPGFQIIQERIVYRGPTAFRQGQSGALIVIDGIHKYEKLSEVEDLVNVSDIHEIKVYTSPGAALKYSGQYTGGLIEITTKNNPEALIDMNDYDNNIEPQVDVLSGFRIYREFYSPNYDIDDSIPKLDTRSTIYWNPEVITNENGYATVSFFNSDLNGDMKIRVEGICNEGLLGIGNIQYQVGKDSIPVHIKKY